MKKFFSAVLMVILLSVMITIFVGCSNDKWISFSERCIADIDNPDIEYQRASLYELKDWFNGQKYWDVSTYHHYNITTEEIVSNNIPLNLYHSIHFNVPEDNFDKKFNKDVQYSKIKFNIEVEKDADLEILINGVLFERRFNAGINEIELDIDKKTIYWSKLLNYYNEYVNYASIYFTLSKEKDVVKWSVNDIKLLRAK